MARHVISASLVEQLLRYLSIHGRSSALEARLHLGISQPTFSRLVARCKTDVMVTGRARNTRYTARRVVPGTGPVVPIYEIDEAGGSQKVGALHAVKPDGFFLESLCEHIDEGFHEDLPYFLQDMRPSGFLGRLIPRRHSQLAVPGDIRLWTADHCLQYLTRFGWNHTGNLILGEDAFTVYLSQAVDTTDLVREGECERRYPELAEDVLSQGTVGSSAAGEQPKFLVRRSPGPVEVLVKFSPPRRDASSLRQGDLLICEHVAHGILTAHGREAVRSRMVEAADRLFLETERFDRVAGGGRRGVVTMMSLDAQYVGDLVSWERTAQSLFDLGIIDTHILHHIRWLACFGNLIGNTDMHHGNLSFITSRTRLQGLAPAYDMLPMRYAPRHGVLPDQALRVPAPRPSEADVWPGAHEAAMEFWTRVSEHDGIGSGFRDIARKNLGELEKTSALVLKLPR